jgi:uncharacterized repeat protein (TIGR02543 family)
MRNSVKKVISGVLAGMMILTAAPISAMAADYQLGDVIADSDVCAPQTLQPKIDVVWTPYTGKGGAFVNDGDESWVADGTTVNDLSKHSVEGKTVEELPSNSKYGKFGFVACTFILRDTAGQFGATQFKFTWDSALTIGNRMGNTGNFKTTPAFEGTGAETLYNSNLEPYMTDDASALSTTDAYISFGNPLDANNNDAYVTRWVGETSSIGDPDAGTVIDGLYICTIGFKVEAGTTISDDLLHFERAEYCGIPYNPFGTDVPYVYTLTGKSWSEGIPVGTIECPMKASAPETKSYTVNYVTEDGASLGTETVEEGKSPASVPALPTKAPDAAGHYSYAWDTDPTTATISADTTFTAKLTTTPHTETKLESNFVDATCDKDGSKTVTTSCSVCGYVISVENVVIPATKHNWGEWKHDDATAKADSKHTHICLNDASHTESEACNFISKVTQQQTADQPEITTYTCKDCGYSYTEETKPALGHTHNYGAPVADYTSGEAFVEGKDYTHTATCTGEGTCSQPTKTDKCTFDNGVETKAATCTEDGVKTFTCTECGGTYTVAIPATGHAWGQWSHDAATAEADATHTRVCANDASHKETKACDFTAKVTQEATLDQAEITTYTCKDCGYSYTKETAPALAGVTVTVNAVENGSVTLAGQDVTAGGSKKFAENGTYTLVATPNEDCTFVGWQTGNKIVSTDATYTTVAVADVTYTPVFAESAKPVQFTFVDMFNNVISSQSVASGADVKIPQAPTYTGYTFTGWSADEATIKAATSSMTVYAQYEKDAAATYTVTTDADATVAYGSNSAQGTLADVPYGTQVTVSKAGATAWAIDGKIVAYGDSYTFYVASDVTVKAASATTQAPVVAAVSANQVAGSYKVEFVATRAMVDGCTYLKSGFVYGKNLTDADLTLANVGKKGSADNSGVVKAAYANSTEGSTQFILSYGISAQTGTASAKAFLTYKDQNGAVKTVYSDVMNHTYA